MNISEQSDASQNEGKKPRPFLWLVVALIALVLCIIYLTLSSAPPEETVDTAAGSSAESSAGSSTEAMPEGTIRALGTPLTTDQLEITLSSSMKTEDIDGGGFMRYSAPNGYSYVVVKATLKNLSNNIKTFKGEDFCLLAADDSTPYPAVQMVVANTQEKYFWAESLNPSFSAAGSLVFEVPESVELSSLRLRYQDTWSTTGIDYYYFSIL